MVAPQSSTFKYPYVALESGWHVWDGGWRRKKTKIFFLSHLFIFCFFEFTDSSHFYLDFNIEFIRKMSILLLCPNCMSSQHMPTYSFIFYFSIISSSSVQFLGDIIVVKRQICPQNKIKQTIIIFSKPSSWKVCFKSANNAR